MTAAYFEDHPKDPEKIILRKPRHKKVWAGLTDQDVQRGFREKCRHFDHWFDERTFIIAAYWAAEKLKERNS